MFRHFPHANAVFFQTHSDPHFDDSKRKIQSINVNTRTLYHLFQFYFNYWTQRAKFNEIKVDDSLLNDNKIKTTIDEYMKNCSTIAFKRFKQFKIDDLSYVSNWLELIGPIYTFPLISSIGVITNLVMLLFSWERYKILLESKTESKLFKINLLWIVIASFLIGCLTSYTKINEYSSIKRSFPSRLESPSLYADVLILDKKWFYLLIYVFHYVLNDFILLSLNLIVDILLFKKLKEDYQSSKFTSHSLHHQSSSTATASIEAESKDLINNSFIMDTFGPFGVNFVQYIYIFSYSFNFLFYFKYSKQFRNAFKNLFKQKKQSS